MNLLGVVAGNAILALAVVAFIVPAGIPMGGATGLGIAGNHFWGIRTSIIVFSLNSILLIIAWFILGKGFVKKTLLSTFIYPLFLELLQKIPGITTMTDNILLSAIFGGLLVGVSMGIVVRVGGSTGGNGYYCPDSKQKNVPFSRRHGVYGRFCGFRHTGFFL